MYHKGVGKIIPGEVSGDTGGLSRRVEANSIFVSGASAEHFHLKRLT